MQDVAALSFIVASFALLAGALAVLGKL